MYDTQNHRRSQDLPYQRLGRRLTELRKETKLTQRELAPRIGISENYLPGLERGRYRPRVDVLERWAAVTGGNKEELMVLAGYLDEHQVPEGTPISADKAPLVREFQGYPKEIMQSLLRIARALINTNDPLMRAIVTPEADCDVDDADAPPAPPDESVRATTGQHRADNSMRA